MRQHIRVEVPNGFDAPVALNLPNGFDINANKKYPILVYSYGGPGNYLQMKQISCCVKKVNILVQVCMKHVVLF